MNQISPIEAAKAATQHWMMNIHDFDGLELSPCHIVASLDDGTEVAEPCTPEEADFWTVYGHFKTGGVDAFEDFDTEAEEQSFHDKLISIYPHLSGANS